MFVNKMVTKRKYTNLKKKTKKQTKYNEKTIQ